YAGQPDTSVTSAAAHSAVKTEEKALRDAAAVEWAKFDASPPIDVKDSVAAVSEHISTAIPDSKGADLIKFRKAYGAEMKIIGDWAHKPASPSSIQAVLRDMRDKIHNNAITGNKSYSDTIARGVVDTLEKSLITGTTANYRQAIEATKRIYDEALPEKFKKVVNSPNVETFMNRLGMAGDEGANTARNLINSGNQEKIASGMNHMRALARKEGVTPEFIQKYEGFLNHFPALKSEFEKGASTVGRAAAGEKA
ncbi:unnamed protein product, partial [marine sediment metagenome]